MAIRNEMPYLPCVEIDFTKDATAPTLLIIHSLPTRIKADRAREIKRVRETFGDRFKLGPAYG